MTIIRCNQCGDTLKKIYYHNYKKTDAGYSRKFPHHLANLYYCDKGNVIYQRQKDRGFVAVLDLDGDITKNIIPPLEGLE